MPLWSISLRQGNERCKGFVMVDIAGSGRGTDALLFPSFSSSLIWVLLALLVAFGIFFCKEA